jgi:two-component system phosphate regulon sensor histidine kinase PhoR
MRGMDTETKKDTMQNYLRMAEQEVSRLDNLVNKIMQTVVGENNSFYQQHVLDLSGIVQSSVQEMQVLASERKATIETENLPYKVLIIGDAFHLQAAIHNLLDNAIKYGGDHPHISISIETSGNYYTLFIQDNGPGIPEAYQKKVFEKFFRIPTGNTHNIKGYGLGLHYVRQVIEACGGTISVHNNPVKGCTFTIQIPRADA